MVRPLIATKGKSLTKDQLIEGMKQDESLHTLIATEYNKNILEYVGNTHLKLRKGVTPMRAVTAQLPGKRARLPVKNHCEDSDHYEDFKRHNFCNEL